ncbi:hypothetical protein PsorP6_000923 [Peronosclerospora sorghi]|uniref:Uncharacterized protein n=1 Tax=Peronosclerospora sorghi TaxID=230839 RepID=A0ACC0WQH4_9STRA|nr:hypothetical protein PsorP6_000923 [Peronosclerospora sorghi]
MNLEQENASLREALRVLQERYDRLDLSTAKKIQDLRDENEILAEANQLLLEKQSSQSQKLDTTCVFRVPDELLLPGTELEIHQIMTVDKVHSFGNLLSVSAHATKYEIVITGGADKSICVHNWKSGKKLCHVETTSPVLALAFNPHREYANFFVAAGMDARHALYKLVEERDEWHIETLCHFHDHSRPGTFRVAWSESGRMFATGSRDKSVNIYQCSEIVKGQSERYIKIKSFYFNGTVEAIVFAPTDKIQDDQENSNHESLVIAVRDDCYVHYVNCSTLEKDRVNMNPDGIEHVSYTIMDLSISPSGKYLLAATDSDRNFIFSVRHQCIKKQSRMRKLIRKNTVLRSFYGHKAGPYSQPRATWHPSEKYVISNNEENGAIFVWSIASERIVRTLDAHDGLVRDLVYLKSDSPVLITVSYDKRLKVWESPLAKTRLEFI